MRTNVVLDQALVDQAKRLTGIRTTRAVIDEALRMLIQLREQAEIRSLRGQLHWDGDLMMMRESRTPVYEVDNASSRFDSLD